MKKDKQFYSWLFAVIVLSVLLVICFYLGISGWFFSNEKEKVTDFQLGNNIEIEVHKNSANSISLNLNGGYLGGEKLKQVVAIKNLDDVGDMDVYVRARAFVYTSKNEYQPLSLMTTSNWVFNENDGYYYFTSAMPAQNKISLCSQIYLDEEYILASSQTYIITFLVETLSVDHTIESFWGYNFIE